MAKRPDKYPKNLKTDLPRQSQRRNEDVNVEMERSGFYDRLAPEMNIRKTSTGSNAWNFDCPSYNNRDKQAAGSNYGVGFTQPVGSFGDAKRTVPALPMGRVNTMRVDNRPYASNEVDTQP